MAASTPLSDLRHTLLSRGLQGMLVPRADAHQSEDCASHDNKLAFLTGFTGSAGLALVLQDRALLFVDGRYQVQARHETDSALFEIHHLHDEPVAEWIAQNLPAGQRIGFEPMLMVNSQYQALQNSGCELVALSYDPFDTIWHDRPAPPQGPVSLMPPDISGELTTTKRARLGVKLQELGVDYLVVTQPDNIAWLLNMRGSDVPMNPVPHSFALVKSNGAVEWFVDPVKLTLVPPVWLMDISLKAPSALLARCQEVAAGKRILLDADNAPVAVSFAVEAGGGEVFWQPDPLTFMKAQKNLTELEGYRHCHLQDGVAWVNFLAWLAREAPARAQSGTPLTELEVQAQQLAYRQQREGFLEQSFATISAAGSNAAMCHYHATPATNAAIMPGNFYLNDSGGQYVNGTTDATRTLAFGEVSPEMRRHYTAVLKGFLGLITLQFPSGTQGHQLDAFARRGLWELGLDYDHGTGHGVGHRLQIHEQPYRIAKKVNPWPMLPGQVITIEPGYYLADNYGIRIENQVEIISGMPGFCRFNSLTLIPVDLRAAELHLLTEQEIAWLDSYHLHVRNELSPLVEVEARPWLFEATAPVHARSDYPG